MRRKITLSILLVVGLMMVMGGVLVARVYALTIDEPWTISAATFNPKGVKYGVNKFTTGRELTEVRIYTEQEIATIKSELDALKVSQ